MRLISMHERHGNSINIVKSGINMVKYDMGWVSYGMIRAQIKSHEK